MDEFSDAVRLFFDKNSVATYSYEKLRGNGQPVARINAKKSGIGASSASADDAGGLDAVVFLTKKS